MRNCWCPTESMSIWKFVQPTCSSWKRVSSVSLFLSFDLMCFIVKKLLSQIISVSCQTCLALIVQISLRRGKRDPGSSFQNSSLLSLRHAWKKGSDWRVVAASFKAAHWQPRSAGLRRGLCEAAWHEGPGIEFLIALVDFLISFLYLAKNFSHLGASFASPRSFLSA